MKKEDERSMERESERKKEGGGREVKKCNFVWQLEIDERNENRIDL